MSVKPTERSRREVARNGVRFLGLVIGLVGLLWVGLMAGAGWKAVRVGAFAHFFRALLLSVPALYPLWIGRKAIRGFSFPLAKHVSGVAAYTLGSIIVQPLRGAGAYLSISSRFWADMIEISAVLAVIVVGYNLFVGAARTLTGCSDTSAAEDAISAP
jgi:hypothetical protein